MPFYASFNQFVLLLGAALAVICFCGCGKSDTAQQPSSSTTKAADTTNASNATAEIVPLKSDKREQEKLAFINRVRPKVEAFCGDCHAMPRPASSARADWTDEVNQGFMLYGTSGRDDLEVPPYDEVLKFFEYQAPETLSLPTSIIGYPPAPLKLRPEGIRVSGSQSSVAGRRPPGVTNVQWMDLGIKDSPALVYCDIGSGAIKAHWPREDGAPSIRLATVFQPVHVEACDLDADGWTDLVVADIGEFNAEDSELGRVVWLRRKPDSEKFETIVLQEPLSRVADVQPGDFDGDGDLDLMVAVFGWRETGRIVMLENLGGIGEELKVEVHEIDPRHGPVHVPPVDLNGDGHLDFVALISQDHEVIEAFLNNGDATFERQLIWAAPDPAYGSSGIELVDMDGDGDLDVLYTNGDSFDRGPKPHHSVQWLENTGSYPYTHHHLAEMPGVLNAKAADFDGDGDLDVVAASLLSNDLNQQLSSVDTSSVVLLTQTSPGRFERSKVESGFHYHLSLELGDFDDDGDTDFAVSTFMRNQGADQPDVIIWWND